ncbi:MAG TPA: PEP-CTERM sorting domain-containing protein [Rhizomicrobium sp.]|jgi:hypothetical protein|nr:PEP-CTERM sorting domain-containing protein [Rhizomicrobium sp.]
MRKLLIGVYVAGGLLAGVNAASADMCASNSQDALASQNCGPGLSATWAVAPSPPNSPPVTPGATLVGSTTDPTGIDGLVVDGTTYNVTFSLTTLNTFTYGTSLSMDAASALAAALTASNVTELGGQTADVYKLDVDNQLNNFDVAYCPVIPSCQTWSHAFGTGGQLGYNGILYTEAADFTPVSVPEPGTLGLFGVALLALGGLGLRRKFV